MLFSISRSFPVSLTRLKLEALSAFVLRTTLSEKRVPTLPDHALDKNARRETGHFVLPACIAAQG
jgi:hypothetical protein